jgi:hypothetical protein
MIIKISHQSLPYILLLFLLTLSLNGCRSSILDDPSTTIDYQIPEDSHVKMTIENNYNTVVAIPVDQDQSAGYYSVNFNASNLLEGVYYYTLEAKGINNNYYYKSTKHMLLIK